MSSETPPDRNSRAEVTASKRSSFWSRHLTLINFWLDVALLLLFLVQGGMFAVLHAVFPRGAGSDWKVWGATPLDLSEMLFQVFCVFSVGVALHLMLHWDWICGVVAIKLLHRKAGKDDGSHTLIGVGLIVIIVHLLAGCILIARLALVGPA